MDDDIDLYKRKELYKHCASFELKSRGDFASKRALQATRHTSQTLTWLGLESSAKSVKR
jgi:hypothetical protein